MRRTTVVLPEPDPPATPMTIGPALPGLADGEVEFMELNEQFFTVEFRMMRSSQHSTT